MDNETEASDRATIAQLNRDALSAVQAETGITIAAHQYSKWRPTVRTTSTIQGLDSACTCVATDGMLGIFVLPVAHPTLGTAFIGHACHFVGGIPPTLHSAAATKAAKPKQPRKKSKAQRMLDLAEYI